MANLFTKHPRSIGETYWQHLKFAGWFAITMLRGGLACTVHAIFPFLFEKTASNALTQMTNRCHSRVEEAPDSAVTKAAS